MGSVLAGVQEQCPDTTRPWAACSEPLLRPPARRGSNRALRAQLPTVLQYDPQFGDAFWNSSKYGMVTYLLRMMTSWAIVCSVWYLPPMTREVGAPRARPALPLCPEPALSTALPSFSQAEEDAVQFANRVKSAIARQGGLVDLLW